MNGYVVRRLAQVPVTVLLISTVAFVVVRLLPGDPALAWLGETLGRDQVAYEAMRTKLHLDEPWPAQFAAWLGQLAHGDMGISARTRMPVGETIALRLPVTLELVALGMLLAMLVAVPAAILSAVRPNSNWDRLGTLVSIAGLAIPDFWLGILLIYLLAVVAKWLPPSGFVPLATDPPANLQLMVMPALTLGLVQMAGIMRQTRSALLHVLGQDFVRTGRAKGLTELRVVARHALPNALLPVVTIIGLQAGRLIGAAVVVETIFAIPGLGRLAADSIVFRDYSALQGVILVFAAWVLVVNLATDLVYAYIDPRIRLS